MDFVLTAIDIEGIKRVAYLEDIEFLRKLSKNQKIYCPECNMPVKLAAGNIRVHHFRHPSNVECTYDTEPESEEHVQGKINIYNWLRKKYPEAKVELEYKIIETNQRADVIVLFPNGEKWAFEMQCSQISGEVWKKRTNLYKQANVKDFWLVGENLHRYGKTKGEVDIKKHRLKDLPLTIFKENSWLFFFNPKSEEITAFYEFESDLWDGSTVLYSKGNNLLLNDLKQIEEFWGNDRIESKYACYKEELKQLMEEEKEEEERLLEIILNNKRAKEKRIRAAKVYQSELNSFSFNKVLLKMTAFEKKLFNNLIKKYSFNKHTFPGICKIHLEHAELILTPYPLWQFYIYDKYIFPSTEGKTKIWIPSVVKDIENKFRTVRDREGDAHFSFTIYRYFEALEKTMRIKCLSKKNKKYYNVISKELPKFNSLKHQSYIAYYLSIHFDAFTEEDERLKNNVMDTWKRYMKNYAYKLPYDATLYNNILEKKESTFHSLFNQYNQVQCMEELYFKNPSCLSRLDSEFLSDFTNHINTDRRINTLQWKKYLYIKKKIESFYNISLDE